MNMEVLLNLLAQNKMKALINKATLLHWLQQSLYTEKIIKLNYLSQHVFSPNEVKAKDVSIIFPKEKA